MLNYDYRFYCFCPVGGVVRVDPRNRLWLGICPKSISFTPDWVHHRLFLQENGDSHNRRRRMKFVGWFLVVVGGLNLIVSIASFSVGVDAIGADRMSQRIGTAIGMLVLGLYLLDRAAKKAAKAEEQNKWINEE